MTFKTSQKSFNCVLIQFSANRLARWFYQQCFHKWMGHCKFLLADSYLRKILKKLFGQEWSGLPSIPKPPPLQKCFWAFKLINGCREQLRTKFKNISKKFHLCSGSNLGKSNFRILLSISLLKDIVNCFQFRACKQTFKKERI